MPVEFFIWLAVVLLIVTVVGHGIWVLLATILRAITGGFRNENAPRDCPVCGTRKVVINGGCRNCGATPFVRPAPQLSAEDENVIVTKRLETLLSSGTISAQEFNRLESLLLENQSPFRQTPSPRTDDIKTLPTSATATSSAPAAEPVKGPRQEPVDERADEFVDIEIVDAEVVEADTATVPPQLSLQTSTSVPAPTHPLDRSDAELPPPRVSVPRRTLASLLQSFMEEKNIRWGEIISGLLIVVCAVGLVVSLWATLRDSIPYLPALIFMVGTAAFHAAGHYTLRSWDLSSISRAVLIIGTLLIPLNFLAAIALSGDADEQAPWTDPTYLAAVSIGLIAYGAMTYFAGRAFLGKRWWRLLAGVMGPCAGQLLINRFAFEGMSGARVAYLVTIPLAGFLIAAVGGLIEARRWKRLALHRIEPLLLVLAMGTFAVLAALALIVTKSNTLWQTLGQVSPALSLMVGATLATGMLIHQRTTAQKLSALRTTGSGLAIGSAFGLIICVMLAWPSPELLVAVCILNAILLASMGMLVGVPVLHGLAVTFGALAWIVAFHNLSGSYEIRTPGGIEILRSFFTGETVAAVGAFAAAIGGLAVALLRMRFARDAKGYFLGAAATLTVSAVLAIVVGFVGLPSSYLTPPTLGIYAVALCLAAWFVRDGRIARAGSVFLLVALVQACGYVGYYQNVLALQGIVLHRPVLFAFLTHGVIGLLAAAGAGRLEAWSSGFDDHSRRWAIWVRPFTETALASSLLAAPSALLLWNFQFGFQAIYLAVIAGIWFGIAIVRRWSWVFLLAHTAATLALAAQVAALHDVQSWAALFHPLLVAGTLLVLSIWCMLAVIGRNFCRRWPSVTQLLAIPNVPTVDRVTLGFLIALLLGTLIVGCLPGVLGELGFEELANDVTISGQHHAFDAWLWGAWLAVSVAVALSVWERITRLCFESLILASAAVPLLIAGPHELQVASLSALRWTMAGFGLVIAAGWSARGWIFKLAARRHNWPGWQRTETQQMATIPTLLVLLSALPVVAATTATVLRVVTGGPLGGPVADSLFANLGTAWSYGVPLGLVSATLLIIAVRDARPSYALGGSIVFQYLASLACLLPPLTAGQPLTAVELAWLGQANAVALGSYGLIWLALRRWIEPCERESSERQNDERANTESDTDRRPSIASQLKTGVNAQIGAAFVLVSVLAVLAAWSIVKSPGNISTACAQLGRPASFVALLLAVAGTVWLNRGTLGNPIRHLICGAGFCLTAFIAAATSPQNLASNWLAFHVLLSGWTLVVVSAVAEMWWQQWRSEFTSLREEPAEGVKILVNWAQAIGALVAMLSVYAAAEDPTGPWWACGVCVALAVSAIAAGLRTRQHRLAYSSTLLLGAAVTYLWMGTILITTTPEILQLAHWLMLAAVTTSGFWLAIEINSQQRHQRSFHLSSRWLAAHRFYPAVALSGLLVTTVFGAAIGALQRGLSRQGLEISTSSGLAATFAIGLLLIAMLWDRRARLVILSIYLWGFAAQVMLLEVFSLSPDNLFLSAGICVAAYIALTGALWRRGANLAAIGMRLGISDPVAGLRRTSNWLPPLSILFGGFAMLVGLILVMAHPEREQRVLTAPIPLLIGIGLGCLAQSGRKLVFQFTALSLLGISCVFLSWADIAPGADGKLWLSRVIRLLIVCCTVSFAYTMIVARRRDLPTPWQMSLKRVGLAYGIGAMIVLVCVLLFETVLYLGNPTLGAPISDIQLVAVSVVMVGLIAALVVMAILPGRDPLGLSERGRMAYVYAAQLAGALLFAHIYLSRPMWFGQWGEYWPYIILLIAFAGAGVGELFQRTGHKVLADPLQRTGTFLPLLPAIGMWFIASKSEEDYALVLFGAGLLYIGLSIGRRSLASALAAVVACNGALWALLNNRGFVIFGQPQLWLIPPALSILIAAEINRKRLSESAITTLRYVGMMVIYLSSAGEIFIRGIGSALWPPMVLLGLSLFGALAGIVLRIRAFLYLGITFVLLSMISMVWHAAESIDRVWPWWAFGIGLGLCMLVFFGFFEKNRDKISALVERLKEWEP